MTVDRDVPITEDELIDAVQTPPGAPEVSTATVVAYAVAGAAVLGWFLFGWLVLRQGFIDSVGESAGAAFALLLIVSIVGTVRRARRR
ncbi:hypothetical protein O7606_16480 [Micromonospora sp. WMMD882]|uniref:hypothetical protein n=1 Tax=Micromonospora sp. WMMD882 TaxID=3015151 RepID=UPI00248AC0FA|nr:hypothetical protein [Micromonospora sp. WMMD882]WBB77862.1 hypothetical protein O7606_16480 [Micromonospora sp. WMMD882]